MTVTITCDDLQTLVNDSTLADATAEDLIDQAINMLNTFRASVNNLTGASGSKTGTYTSTQAGAIMAMAMQVYIQMYKSSGASSSAMQLGGVSESSSSSTGGGAGSLLEYAQVLAAKLTPRSFKRT